MVNSLTSCIVMGTLAKIAHQLLKSGFSQNTDLWWSIWLNLWDRYQHSFAMDNNEHTTLPLLSRMHVCNPRATVSWCTFFSRLIQVEEFRNCFNNVPLPIDPYRSLTVPVSRHLDPHNVQLWVFCWPTKELRADFRAVVEARDPTVRGAQMSWCRKLAPLPSEVTTQWLTSSGNLGWILHSNRNSRWWYSLGSTVGPFSRNLLPCWWDRILMVVPCNSQTAMYQVLDASLKLMIVLRSYFHSPCGTTSIFETYRIRVGTGIRWLRRGLDLDTPRTPAKPEGADGAEGAEDADGAGAAVDGATLTDNDRVEATSGSPSLSDDTTTVSATTLSKSSSRRSNNGWERLGRFHAKHPPRYLNSGSTRLYLSGSKLRWSGESHSSVASTKSLAPAIFTPGLKESLHQIVPFSWAWTLPLVHTTQKHR